MMERSPSRALVTALVAISVSAIAVAAQVTTASVSGSIRDAQGGVIPGATLTLISETLGTQTADVFSNEYGDFVFANIRPDRYTVQVTMDGFKTLRRAGIDVSAGDRVGLGPLTIELGGKAETVTVESELPLLQTQSAERSFTLTAISVQNFPISNRSFVQLATMAPGVAGTGNNPARLGGGGQNNIMMDGISTMDTGSNAVLLQMNVESIAEVTVLTSNYQAEFGRSSGLQVTAVTKSGTNSFHGSVYGVFRDSRWNANTRCSR
jgi:Carboxypeptidase regulatory-like domain